MLIEPVPVLARITPTKPFTAIPASWPRPYRAPHRSCRRKRSWSWALSRLVNTAAAHTAHTATGRSPQRASGPARCIAGASWAWKDRTRHRWHWRRKARRCGGGKRRRRNRCCRHIDCTHLHCRECDEGRANRPNCDDTNECLHLVITQQVACRLGYWHHSEEGSQRPTQFDGEGRSFRLK